MTGAGARPRLQSGVINSLCGRRVETQNFASLPGLYVDTRIDLAAQAPADSSASQTTFWLGFRSASEIALPSFITLVDLPTIRRTSPPFSSLTTSSFFAVSIDTTSPLTVFAAFWADEAADWSDCRIVAPANPMEARKRTREKANMNFFIHVYSLVFVCI